ncbi:MAG: cation/multidrug efflux pump [Bacteroidetes bacterium]|nr:MAG: cation/multidrug efflux pump [Bacteroidota bacterium]
MLEKIKEFKPTSWSIDNKTTIFILTVFLAIAGILYYQKLPKESFPEVKVPTIYIQTAYFGTSPTDMENLVAKPLEKQIKAISGVKKITSSSLQDFSVMVVEFNTDVKVEDALRKVKDKIDRAKKDLPAKLDIGPDAQEINFSEFPIMFVNISGDYDLAKLKRFAESLKDRIEGMKEITRVDMVGALDREIQINVDMYKMQSYQLTLGDINRAIASENVAISGGTVTTDGVKRTLALKKEFRSVEELKNILVGSQSGAFVYLKDVADVTDGFKEQESYARLDGKNVITLNIIKRAGENLIVASDEIRAVISEMQENRSLPAELNVTITGDQSDQTRITLHDLINTIIIGFILVIIVLMFFMGATNSFFVALSVPLSMAIAFMVIYAMGWSMNMIVLFAFLLALGIVVDDAIVVIENTHRIFLAHRDLGIVRSAKLAAGEVFLPVLSGTLTTLAPFIPLAFWDGMIGQFMIYLPITLIITLLASLLVAYIINPVFAVQFMRHYDSTTAKDMRWPRWLRNYSIISIVIAGGAYAMGSIGTGNLAVLLYLLVLLHHYVLRKWIFAFQERTWPRFRNWYGRKLTWAIEHPKTIIFGTIGLFFLSFVVLGIRQPRVDFFPTAEPNFIYAYIEMPVGTDQVKTNAVSLKVEERINKLLGEDKDIVTSVIANVAFGAGDPQAQDNSIQPHKAKVSVAFTQFAKRKGKSTRAVLERIQKSFAEDKIPGAEIIVEQEQGGPPVGKPISIEITGEKMDDLLATGDRLKKFLDSCNIAGVERLRSDVVASKPEIVFSLDRERANREGIFTGQVGMEIRNSVFGAEVSKFRDENDEYPIMLRYKPDQRSDINAIRNMKITYRDMNMGGLIRNVPISSFADVSYDMSYGGIKRKGQKRIITLESNILAEFQKTQQDVITNVTAQMNAFKNKGLPPGVMISMGGQQQEQAETAAFLGGALLASIGLIIVILVAQFNSTSKPVIILSEILFSVIGVFLGLAIFGMNVSIIMTGIGIVALAGIVVRNGILIVEFIEILRERGMPLKEAVIEAGKTRMTPVLLTATAMILGLIPLAVGLNIDFGTLLSEFNPNIFFGGDSVAFWGPLSWTMIYGLSFATILTLIVLPVMYMMSENTKARLKRAFGRKARPENHAVAGEEEAKA